MIETLDFKKYDLALYEANKIMELIGYASGVLQSEVFRERQYNQFFDIMLRLIGGKKAGVRPIRVTKFDMQNGITIDFLKSKIGKSETQEFFVVHKRIITIGYGTDNDDSLEYGKDPESWRRGPILHFNGNSASHNSTPRNFCLKVFNLYLASQHSPQPQPRSRVG